jgi:hypothetical protein
MGVTVGFCGERYPVKPGAPLTIGREGELAIEDNPYLHRHFLRVSVEPDLVWLANIGNRLSATLADDAGLMQAWLAPGARLPVIFNKTMVWFTAGPTTYELEIELTEARFEPAVIHDATDGQATVGRISFTPDQQLLILALAEPVLRRDSRGSTAIPSTADAAGRLGWSTTKFNRKLDNVCEKLTRTGVRGLHGSSDRLATSRRARLVEYALAAQLVTPADLSLLEMVGPQ